MRAGTSPANRGSMRPRSRKILLASLGVASITFTSCTRHPTGNLRSYDASPPDTAHATSGSDDTTTQPKPAEDTKR
jgi:hypothetical protein